ncbi:MAG: hypothetical protein ILO42_00265 [Clostridia bacterium]|nr:hypothetical protein [Clostridia bacterium]
MLISLAKSAAVLGNLCGKSDNVAIGVKDNCWLGVFITKPSSDGTGGVEPSAENNYSRVNISWLMNATNRSIVNLYDINFNMATDPSDRSVASGHDWGTVVGFGLFSAQTGGTLYGWGDLSASITINTGNSLNFGAGNFEVFLDASENASATV